MISFYKQETSLPFHMYLPPPGNPKTNFEEV
mgnify:CR=1 FL=1